MNSPSSDSDSYQYSELLADVSRSFYLSMRFLPAPMREPVSLAYLLARATDTVADAAAVWEESRLQTLDLLHDRICGETDTGEAIDFYLFQNALSHQGEVQLLAEIDQVLAACRKLDEGNRTLIAGVLDTIITGQKWDIKNFRTIDGKLHCCRDSEELLQYTYRVAGCVGEFWTEVGFQNMGEKFARSSDRESMLISGRKLGQGLQLINILRDLHEDIPQGRCYLPADELQQRGWEENAPLKFQTIKPVADKWIAICREFLEEGGDYVRKVRSPRARFATYLPQLLAEATADRLEQIGMATAMRHKIKISRSKVWACALRAVFG